MSRRALGIGLIGFGWLGQAHSRSFLRIPTLFPERVFVSRAVDLAHMLVGPIVRVVGAIDTFIPERPLPGPGTATQFGAERRPFTPGFAEALDYVSVQAALLESCRSGRWEDVVPLREA